MAEQTYIQREAPEIEALKLALMEAAKKAAEEGVDIPAYQVAGLTDLQKAALQKAGGMYDPTTDIEQAKSLYGATIGQDPEAVRAAMDPYISEVIEGAQQDIYDQARMQQAQLGQQAAGAGAFGRRRDLLESDIGIGAAEKAGRLGGQLRSQGYADAMARLGAAGQGIAGLGQLQQQLEQQGIGFGFDVGAKEQQFSQAELDALRQSQLQQLYEPYQRLGFLSDIYQGAPSSTMTTTTGTTPGAPSPMQQLFGYGIAGLSAAAGAKNLGLFG